MYKYIYIYVYIYIYIYDTIYIMPLSLYSYDHIVARSLDVLSRSLSMCFLSPLYIFSDYDVSYIYLFTVLLRFDSIYDSL
jgi:hypothetical protein